MGCGNCGVDVERSQGEWLILKRGCGTVLIPPFLTQGTSKTNGAKSETDILKDVKETDEHECPGCHQRRSRSFKLELKTHAVPEKVSFKRLIVY